MSKKSIEEERRYGRFAINPKILLRLSLSDAAALFRNIVVLNCTQDEENGLFVYDAASPYFAPIGQDEQAPWYQVALIMNKDKTVLKKISWSKQG